MYIEFRWLIGACSFLRGYIIANAACEGEFHDHIVRTSMCASLLFLCFPLSMLLKAAEVAGIHPLQLDDCCVESRAMKREKSSVRALTVSRGRVFG